jgi:hypothetical protein
MRVCYNLHLIYPDSGIRIRVSGSYQIVRILSGPGFGSATLHYEGVLHRQTNRNPGLLKSCGTVFSYDYSNQNLKREREKSIYGSL